MKDEALRKVLDGLGIVRNEPYGIYRNCTYETLAERVAGLEAIVLGMMDVLKLEIKRREKAILIGKKERK